jgi:hypothetical protein
VNDATQDRPTLLADQPISELSGEVEPPPALVARVMTELSQPRTPSLWKWLQQPFLFQIRLSPMALILGTLVLAGAFVLLGAALH